jgi:hypothetical protein
VLDGKQLKQERCLQIRFLAKALKLPMPLIGVNALESRNEYFFTRLNGRQVNPAVTDEIFTNFVIIHPSNVLCYYTYWNPNEGPLVKKPFNYFSSEHNK